ncbi:MAG: PASTA domain-containing protein [Propionicimonas sp.]
MPKRRLIAAFVLILALAGCSSPTEAPTMPDVVGLKLDIALSDIKRAGVRGEVEVLGGGVFGVVDESNWEVCEQLPQAGATVTDSPRLTVERSCGGEQEEPASAGPTPSEEPSEEPVEEPEEAEELEEPEEPTASDRERAEAIENALYEIFMEMTPDEILASDPTLWAGYIVDIRVEGDLAYFTLQIGANDTDRDEFGGQAAKALSTLLPAEVVEGIDWLIVEDGTGAVIAQEQPNPYY